MDFFRREYPKFGVPVENDDLQDYHGLTRLAGKARQLLEHHIPRGVAMARLTRDRPRVGSFMSPGELIGYPTSYESFLGNAGLVQMFANGDGLTLDYADAAR